MSKQADKRGGEVRRVLADTAARLGVIENAAHKERARIEDQLRAIGARVKGTRDMTSEARAVAGDQGADVRIEVALRAAAAPLSMLELVAATGLPAARVNDAMKRLRETPCPTRSAEHAPDTMTVYNHGTDTEPRWGWVVGDKVDTSMLYAEIERMLRRRPYSFAELTAATGARRGRISGATVEFARSDIPIYTVGASGRRYRWFIGAISQLPSDMRRQAVPVRIAPDSSKR